ncbi:TetR/AcrR family transcriptional regulator [Nocardioides sp. zg-536]|uniref:TetR/AcrR family transcriptional regulator n=1 Tax=Nocardioides faecalis TaxID=2803858 RepID=A0A938Y6L6_9ACTN|nr:TetR/AcrR family transcriptional regulator [Nocardioides faecalis]MBM9460220.1 TetR/AcrR family transcriptional regulator [Nocardioides faecalis]MBS4754658.1 TetR/AcrR family transcriptional regulator [Nocardioides faecalis]QVI59990.1 TetR/AcrR family transcriptional regulator [Nocardioides faecalis]
MGPAAAEHPVRRRLDPDVRREQLLVAAERLFAERPYSAVSATEIARAAGVARGLLNHYFGDKRGLYLEVVRRAALLPEIADTPLPSGPLDTRVDVAVHWFLESITPQRASYLTVRAAEGVGEDAEVRAILDEAHDLAARRVLEMVGGGVDDPAQRAAVRAYGELARGALREFSREGALSREQAHLLLREALLAIVQQVLPRL